MRMALLLRFVRKLVLESTTSSLQYSVLVDYLIVIQKKKR